MTSFIGRICQLTVARVEWQGAFLELKSPRAPARETPEFALLPASEVPSGTQAGQSLAVFIYLDAEARPMATLKTPALVLGDVAFLEVVDSAPFGSFVDMHISKHLLVPFKEQVRPMDVGGRYAVALYIDDTGRLAGTTRISEIIQPGGDFDLDEWVEGVIWREEPELGTFVILERQYLGLLPAVEYHRMAPGESGRFRVSHIHADGKIEVSLRAMAYQELEADAERVFELLTGPAAPRLGDRTDAEVIRELLGISKKAFKRATGRLLKRGVVEIGRDGFLQVKSAPTPEVVPQTTPSGKVGGPAKPSQGSLSGKVGGPAKPSQAIPGGKVGGAAKPSQGSPAGKVATRKPGAPSSRRK